MESFREFLRKEYSEENIEFWIECEEFKKRCHCKFTEPTEKCPVRKVSEELQRHHCDTPKVSLPDGPTNCALFDSANSANSANNANSTNSTNNANPASNTPKTQSCSTCSSSAKAIIERFISASAPKEVSLLCLFFFFLKMSIIQVR